MGPEQALPIDPNEFQSVDEYINSLLDFATSSNLLKTLCGGVHVLDVFTSDPPLYSVVIPETWRAFFELHSIHEVLDLLMREPDLDALAEARSWRKGPVPPEDLITYIRQVRRFSLRRSFVPLTEAKQDAALAREVGRGMKVKKAHEVDHFSRFVNDLTTEIARDGHTPITHLIDFGSGQGYLPRRLASSPYKKHMVAVESKGHNVEGAKFRDLKANMTPKELAAAKKAQREEADKTESLNVQNPGTEFVHPGKPSNVVETVPATVSESDMSSGSIQHVEHWIADGDLSKVIQHIKPASDNLKSEHDTPQDPNMMVISLHSCGNLVHHGIRSLLMNPTVHAIALVGCCYNLMTERLGPPTYKLPSLRSAHPRLTAMTNTADPHGFPLSKRYCNLPTPSGTGLRLNITARMMAVQAPANWGPDDSEMFFTRHFYRAVLQRILFDLGLVTGPTAQRATDRGPDSAEPVSVADHNDEAEQQQQQQQQQQKQHGSPSGFSGASQPVLIGSLGKSCYENLTTYVRGAARKLLQNQNDPTGRSRQIGVALSDLSDDRVKWYEDSYASRKIDMSVLWSLMAFSAGVVEALIVVDRYLFLIEQECVQRAWVQTVFDYRLSPRNLVVVGIKKTA